jgi:hypothetical protein
MAYRALLGVAAAAVLCTACDVSQKTPQTASLPTASAIARPVGAPAADPSPEAAGGEKSIRLFGPGVSRKRQTRI